MLTVMTPRKEHSDVQRRRTLLGALLVAALVAAGCSTQLPTPAPTGAAEPTASTQSTPAPSAVAAEPKVVCPTPTETYPPASPNPTPRFLITLTCENAVAAAKAVVGPDTTVTSIEFRFGQWCPAGQPCLLIAVLNGGYVLFHRKSGLPDLVVVVRADEAGKVTASRAVIAPS